MYESISKNNELENEMTLDMSYFWYSDAACRLTSYNAVWFAPVHVRLPRLSQGRIESIVK